MTVLASYLSVRYYQKHRFMFYTQFNSSIDFNNFRKKTFTHETVEAA